MASGMLFMTCSSSASVSFPFLRERTYWQEPGKLRRNMSRPPNLDERFMKTVKFWRLQLGIVEAEEVVHDDVASKCWEGIGQIQRLLASFEFLDS
jgi:hypothetical protein